MGGLFKQLCISHYIFSCRGRIDGLAAYLTQQMYHRCWTWGWSRSCSPYPLASCCGVALKLQLVWQRQPGAATWWRERWSLLEPRQAYQSRTPQSRGCPYHWWPRCVGSCCCCCCWRSSASDVWCHWTSLWFNWYWGESVWIESLYCTPCKNSLILLIVFSSWIHLNPNAAKSIFCFH